MCSVVVTTAARAHGRNRTEALVEMVGYKQRGVAEVFHEARRIGPRPAGDRLLHVGAETERSRRHDADLQTLRVTPPSTRRIAPVV